VRAVAVEDKNSAVETVSREKATNDPGSVGATMSGVVVEVRVKEGQEIKKGDPLCSTFSLAALKYGRFLTIGVSRNSSQRHEGEYDWLLLQVSWH
jgi:pyruvate carboxylase